MLSDFTGALADARKTVEMDPTYMKGYSRIAKCCINLGDIATAENFIQRALEIEPDNQSFNPEKSNIETVKYHLAEAQRALEKEDYRKVVYCMDRCIAVSCACSHFRLLKAESLAFLGRFQEGEELANNVLAKDKSSIEAIYVRGLCLYFQDNLDKALTYFQTVLRLAPDFEKAKVAYKKAKLTRQLKDEGNQLYNSGKLVEAAEKYTSALEVDALNCVTNSKLFCNRAAVSAKLNQFQEVIDDCNRALKLDPQYQKALLRRAIAYSELKNYEEAVKDYEALYKMNRSRENKKMWNDAKLELKKSKRKDYYKILGLSKNASDDDIKKAYKKKALEHHPDRHANTSDVEKKEHERLFKDVGEAYAVLMDAKKRGRYDNGHDLDDEFDGHGFNPMDAANLFSQFDGNDMGFNFQSHGFPSNFSFHFG
ncbi:Hypothetical predicted protein [Cloeon dipterum]|uniref:J domain-containing protein n=2 Tax=Cloeon dipterum TaxID=197152 RepID=A0A8S1DXI5_9INSE|nr:Hypothetical predicted protein [Cloeon dipterum]